MAKEKAIIDNLNNERVATLKEFKLSEKFNTSCPFGYDEEDIKEFLRLLKEEFLHIAKPFNEEYGLFVSDKRFKEVIDKLAGDDLI